MQTQTYYRNAKGEITVRFDDLNRRNRERLFALVGERVGIDKRDDVGRFLHRIGAYGRAK